MKEREHQHSWYPAVLFSRTHTSSKNAQFCKQKNVTENRTKSHKQLLSPGEGSQGCQRCVAFIKCDRWVCSKAKHRATRNTLFQALRGGEAKLSNRITFLDKKEGGLFRSLLRSTKCNFKWPMVVICFVNLLVREHFFHLGYPLPSLQGHRLDRNITVITSSLARQG